MALGLNDIVQVRVVSQAGTSVAINVRHYRVSAAVGPVPTEAQVATDLSSFWHNEYKAVIALAGQFRGVGVRHMRPSPPGLESFDIGLLGAGTVAGDRLPGQICGLITLTTQFAGRRYRGRVYLPFTGEAANDVTGVPTPAHVVNMQALAAKLIVPKTTLAGGGSITLTPIIWHRDIVAFSDIINYRVIARWATQRRRDDYHTGDVPPF